MQSVTLETFDEHHMLQETMLHFKQSIVDVLFASLSKKKDLTFKIRGFNKGARLINCTKEIYMALFGGCSKFKVLDRRPANTEEMSTFMVDEFDFNFLFSDILHGVEINKVLGTFTLSLQFPFIVMYERKKKQMFMWVNTLVMEDGRKEPLVTYNPSVLKKYLKRAEEKAKRLEAALIKKKKIQKSKITIKKKQELLNGL